jgi:WD40 repeat protein
MSCAVSPDEKRLASGSSDGTLKLWEAGQEILTLINGPDGEAAAVDFANNRILHASPEAWRFLSWRYFDPKRGMYRLLPGDYFEPFPVG